ncbi:toxin-antitoxin system HicB family antitoxin [Streptomyces sp. TRM66268-LWL]|uniref:Toxin-antitoxin system HicB family antitoxin n=1 Tax=Streptomyces polyasparticus TaxID=2767826 RepID=A0ABR7SJD4_9ACTN|nr:toxin-antitoxin system HicB family antitoxin [Streptomyces polyasparticus]MBC9714596.1 toxin-antitoxin system HicB family antitoxin [Streptomyces polyasparticus]
MDLTPYVDNLRQELATAAETAGPEARAMAERLTWPLESAARLALLNALSDAMAEVTRELAPGSVGVRLRGTDPEFVVSTPQPDVQERAEPTAYPMPAAAPEPAAPDEGGTSRINLRLAAHLKVQAEEAAAREGLSLNAWLGRAVAAALTPPPAGPHHRDHARDFTGWAG